MLDWIRRTVYTNVEVDTLGKASLLRTDRQASTDDELNTGKKRRRGKGT